jgi:hypothetical protein
VEPCAAGARIRPRRERTHLVDLPLFPRRDPPHQPPPSTSRCDAVGDHLGLSNGRAAGHRVRLFPGHGRIRCGPADPDLSVKLALLSGVLFLPGTRVGSRPPARSWLWPESAAADPRAVALLRFTHRFHTGPRSFRWGGRRQLYVSVPEAAEPVPTRLAGIYLAGTAGVGFVLFWLLWLPLRPRATTSRQAGS